MKEKIHILFCGVGWHVSMLRLNNTSAHMMYACYTRGRFQMDATAFTTCVFLKNGTQNEHWSLLVAFSTGSFWECIHIIPRPSADTVCACTCTCVRACVRVKRKEKVGGEEDGSDVFQKIVSGGMIYGVCNVRACL